MVEHVQELTSLDPSLDMTRTVDVLKRALETIPVKEGDPLELGAEQARTLELVVQKVSEAEAYFDRPVDEPVIYERLVAIGEASGMGELVERFGQRTAQIKAADLEFNARLQAFFGASTRAAELFGEAVALTPDFTEAVDGLGKAERRVEKAKGRVVRFKEKTDRNERDPKAWIELGGALADVDQVEKALKCFSNAVRLAPDDPNALCKKGGALAVMGQLDEAKECFEAALAIEPKSLNAKRGLNYTNYLLNH